MRKCITKLMCAVTAFVSLLSMQRFPQTPVTAEAVKATAAKKPVVVVSLGDSYSSGEGIEPFYGQFKSDGSKVDWDDKSFKKDWLAHRSTLSWPGKLEIPGVPGTLSDYKMTGEGQTWYDECRWYFAASSGAETKHFYEEQEKPTKKDILAKTIDHELPPQLDIFDTVKANGDTVDYVTMTIGGNDVGFADIVRDWFLGSHYLAPAYCVLENKIENIWADWDSYAQKIAQAYIDAYEASGDHPDVIIAGYPQLLTCDVTGYDLGEIPTYVATVYLQESISDFNDRLEWLVSECNRVTKTDHFYFADVEKLFLGHEAYSDDPWINSVDLFANPEDLVHPAISSAYSMHPNEDGAMAYAGCVNIVIKEIEEKKASGETIYGIAGAEWVVDPTIEADDILVGDHWLQSGIRQYSPYVYIERDGKYGLIDYNGDIAVEPEYDSFNGSNFYGLDAFIAVYDSESGDTMFVQSVNGSNGVWEAGDDGKWEIVEQEKAYGQPGIGTSATTYFIDENDGEFYRYNMLDMMPEAIYGGVDTSYIVQNIDYVPAHDGCYGIEMSSVKDEKFYLYNDELEKMLTDGYKYVYANGSGYCQHYTGLYTTVAFSDNNKTWDIYDYAGNLVASDLEPFDCNTYYDEWWTPPCYYIWAQHQTEYFGRPAPFCATEGYIAAKIDGKCGYLDLDGNVVIEFGILDDVRPVHDGMAWVKYNGKWGVISLE